MMPGRTIHEYQTEFWLDIAKAAPWQLPVNAQTSPASVIANSADFGIACAGPGVRRGLRGLRDRVGRAAA